MQRNTQHRSFVVVLYHLWSTLPLDFQLGASRSPVPSLQPDPLITDRPLVLSGDHWCPQSLRSSARAIRDEPLGPASGATYRQLPGRVKGASHLFEIAWGDP